MVKISDFCQTGSGGTPSRDIPEYYEGDIPWIKSGDLRENIVTLATEFISQEAINKSSAKIVSQGAILVAMYGATVGRMALLGIDAATNQAVCNVVPDASKADTKYVYYALLSKVPDFLRSAIGGAQPNISQGLIRSTEIPLPPLPEQKRIATILDKADAIRRKRQQAIQLADDFLRAVFLDMFGDPNSNPKNVDVLPMIEVFDIKTGKLNSNAAIEGGKYPFFTCAKEVFAIDEYAFDQEALLLAGNNAQADYDVKHYKGRFNAYQRTYVLTLRNSTWSYPFYKFALQYQLSNLKYASKGSSTKYITMEIMGRTMLPVPGHGDQKRFVDHFEQVGSVQTALLVQAQNDENLFSALSNRAFSGQL